MAESDNDSGGPSGVLRTGSSEFAGSKEQDRYLPIANVSRIMKKALPANAKISKEAKETLQECVSEFISFITGEASDKCQKEKRKTINGDDILSAMTTLGFDDYVEPLKVYLQKYREMEGERTPLSDRQQGDQSDHGTNGGEGTSSGGFNSGISGFFRRSTAGSGYAGVYGQSGEKSTELMMMSQHTHGNHQKHMSACASRRGNSSGRTRGNSSGANSAGCIPSICNPEGAP